MIPFFIIPPIVFLKAVRNIPFYLNQRKTLIIDTVINSHIPSIKSEFDTEIKPEKPSVITYEPTGKTQTNVTLYGEITTDGGAEITERGFYWSETIENLNKGGTKVIIEGTTGEMIYNLEGLQPDTYYYYKDLKHR